MPQVRYEVVLERGVGGTAGSAVLERALALGLPSS